MTSLTSKKYKCTIKKLRKNSTYPSNNRENVKKQNLYNYLSILNEDVVEDENNSTDKVDTEINKENYEITFNDLPEDTINIILEYLPIKTRLAILKHKYSKKNIKYRLDKIPKTNKGLKILYNIAKIARDLLTELIDNDSNIFLKFSKYSIEHFLCDLKYQQSEKYSSYYKTNFTGLIMAVIKNYSRIYKGIKKYNKIYLGAFTLSFKHMYYPNKKVIEHTEKIILNLFAHFVSFTNLLS